MPCETCLHEQNIADIKAELERNRNDKRGIYDRLGALEREDSKRDEQFKHIQEGVDELKEDLRDLKEKPSKRWESIVAAAITTGVGALIGFLLSKLLGA